MKKNTLAFLCLACVLSGVIIFHGVPLIMHKPDMYAGFGGLVPFVFFLFFWGIIFLSFIINKLLQKHIPNDENNRSKRVGMTLFALVISIVVIAVLFRFFESM